MGTSQTSMLGCLAALGVLLVSCTDQTSTSERVQTSAATAGETAVETTMKTLSLEDYQRAESRLAANTNPLVTDIVLASYWQGSTAGQEADATKLIYRKRGVNGLDYRLVDLVTQGNERLLDLSRLQPALVQLSDAEDIEQAIKDGIVLSNLELRDSSEKLRFNFENETFELQLNDYSLSKQDALSKDDEFLSPDKQKAVFISQHNLWLRNTLTDELTQLTEDGFDGYGYGTNNAGWLREDGPVLLWSPDSSKIATFRHDGREVRDMALWDTRVGHSEIDVWKYPLPGDDAIFQIERLVIHLEKNAGEGSTIAPRLVKLNMPADPHRTTISDHVAGNNGELLDVQWSSDSDVLAFVSSSRDHKVATLRLADPFSGAVTDVLTEETETYYESGSISENWRVLHGSNEALWFSERDNWGHLYLYDLSSGELKRQVTSGDWAVMQLQYVDEENRQIYFTGSNKEPGDPYFHYLYRASLDGGEPELLTPDQAHHRITWSEDKSAFVDNWSTPTQAPDYAIRDQNGELVLSLEKANIEALLASGWVAPQPFVVKARDRLTDIHGLMYKPSNFDESASYPVLNYLYPGPQSGSIGSRSFVPSRNDKQALAELGFIVVEIDAMGTPGRSKSFHDAYYGNMGDNGLPDQITAIEQLAQANSWMDIDRVGIWGHSGGGFASTAGILRYPDFYKVAVSGAGNHDNRNYEDDWGEKWQGLLVEFPETDPNSPDDDGSTRTNYDNQANQLLVGNLKGKLLLAHGLMDSNVHPSNTMLVVDALIAAEKDFDLLILPNAGHGFGNQRYFMKRRWDYFVTHLQQLQPPEQFRFAQNIR